MIPKYEIFIHWSHEDNAFIAEVPDLSGCMAHGNTPTVAVQNANEAIQLWLDTAREFGDSIPEPRSWQLVPA